MDATVRLSMTSARQTEVMPGLGSLGACQSTFPVRTSKRVRTLSLEENPWGNKRRMYVMAIGTSSRPKGAGRKLFMEPQWLFSSSNSAEEVRQSTDRGNDESVSAKPGPSGQLEDQNLPQDTIYHIVIITARDEKSGFSEPSTGIFLALIGENQNAILGNILGEDDAELGRSPRFQRGATDAFSIVGPDLGRIAALWIAPAAGTWRIEKVSVTIAPRQGEISTDRLADGANSSSRPSSDDHESSASPRIPKERKPIGMYHLFKSNEMLLGDAASWVAAAQLKPSEIHEILDPEDLRRRMQHGFEASSRTTQTSARLRDESMKEYENLKLSLLASSLVITGAGVAILTILGRGQLAEGFALGGAGGFLYLLLLQRVVDQVPSSLREPAAQLQIDEEKDILRLGSNQQGTTNQDEKLTEASTQGNAEEKRGKQEATRTMPPPTSFRQPSVQLRTIALVAGAALVVGRLAGGGGAASVVNPAQLLAGVAGFFTSRVAVVISAFRQEMSSKPGEDGK